MISLLSWEAVKRAAAIIGLVAGLPPALKGIASFVICLASLPLTISVAFSSTVGALIVIAALAILATFCFVVGVCCLAVLFAVFLGSR